MQNEFFVLLSKQSKEKPFRGKWQVASDILQSFEAKKPTNTAHFHRYVSILFHLLPFRFVSIVMLKKNQWKLKRLQ